MQLGSRAGRGGSGGGGGGRATLLDAATERRLLGLGLAVAEAAGVLLCFWRPSLDWTAGRAEAPGLVQGLDGVVVAGRRGDAEMVFIFLSSLRKAGLRGGFGSAAVVLVRLPLVSVMRRGLAGTEVRLEGCIVGFVVLF